MILAEDLPVATATNATPRYRYHEEAPETVSVPARELMEHLPGELRRRGADESEGRVIEIPSADLLGGNIPKIALGRLQDLLPDLVQIPGGRDAEERITLPPGWIALHFRMVTRREELPLKEGPEEPKDTQQTKETESADSKHVANAEASQSPEIIAEVEAVGVDRKAAPNDRPIPAPIAEIAQPTESPIPTKEPETNASPRKSLFDSLPIFRRRHAAVAPAAEAPYPTEAIKEETPEKKEKVPEASLGDTPPVESSKALTVERLWKLDPQDRLADPSALQALFMTEEKLTLESVISKAGQLPGLKACVLAHGDQVLCTSNATAGVDLRTLSGQAMTMLGQIRETSASMGLGAVPAVTLHAEQGALSFLHNGELCLLVLHADRGFVPGVRERLQQMLVHLAEAKPTLPSSPTGSQSEGHR